jgi:hypothetical protein
VTGTPSCTRLVTIRPSGSLNLRRRSLSFLERDITGLIFQIAFKLEAALAKP